MEIKDLVGLSKPLTKLIDVFSNGCKWVFEPVQIRMQLYGITQASSNLDSLQDIKDQIKSQYNIDYDIIAHKSL